MKTLYFIHGKQGTGKTMLANNLKNTEVIEDFGYACSKAGDALQKSKNVAFVTNDATLSKIERLQNICKRYNSVFIDVEMNNLI